MCHYKNYQCIRIGVGMISRGEVALIVASKGEEIGLLSSNFLGPVVLVVIVTTIVTPILLKYVFHRWGPAVQPVVETPLSERYEQLGQFRAGLSDPEAVLRTAREIQEEREENP